MPDTSEESRHTGPPASWWQRAMQRVRSLPLAGLANVIVGNGAYAGLGLLASIIAANGLSPEAFGYLSIAIAVLVVLQEVCGMGLDIAMVRLAAEHARSDSRRSELICRAAFRLKLGVNGVLAAAVAIGAGPVAEYFYADSALSGPLRWAAAGLLGSALYQYVLARLQTNERFRAYGLYRALNNTLKVALLALLWWSDSMTLNRVLAVWMGVFILSFAVGMLFTTRISARPREQSERELWRDVLKIGRWIIASQFLFAVYGRIDLLVLGSFRDIAEVGYYSIATNLTYLIDLCTYSVIIVLLPRAARLQHASEFSAYARSTLSLCVLFAIALVPLYILADDIIRLLFPDYLPALAPFKILFFGPLVTLMVHPLYLILYSRNRMGSITLVNLVLASVCTALAVLLVPEYGMQGAAGAAVAARVISCAMIVILVVRELRQLQNPQPKT